MVNQAETPKRLTPEPETIRHLFAYSGNVCAFEGCTQPLIDSNGLYVGETCHIEAALPGGERFNPNMTNEQRRHRDNLILMCGRHHKVTNDIVAWPVERLKALKKAHEDQFDEAVRLITAAGFRDVTAGVDFALPKTLQRMNDVGKWGVSVEQAQEESLPEVLALIEGMRRLAPATRELLLIVVERAESYRDDLGLRTDELEQATGKDADELKPHIETMTKYRVAALDEDYDWDNPRWWVKTITLDSGWGFWREAKAFCEAEAIPLSTLILDLRFDVLDTGSIAPSISD